MGVPRLFEHRFEWRLRQVEHHDGVHLQEAPVAVPGERRIAAQGGEPFHRAVVEAEVEDRLHHPGHRHRGAAAHRHQQRHPFAAEFLAGGGLQPLERALDLGAQARGKALGLEIGAAHGGRNGEAGRHRDAEVRHLRQTRALAAEDVLHRGRAVRAALPEEVDQRLGQEGFGHAGALTGGAAWRK